MAETATVMATFRLNLKDYLKLMIYNYTRLGALALRLVICLWLALLFSFREAMFYDDWLSLAWSMVIALGLLFVFAPISEMRLVQNQARENGLFAQDITVEITPETTRSNRDYIDVAYKWEAVRNVVRTQSATYIFVGTAQAWIVPARAFSSSDAAERFFTVASGYWQAVHKARRARRH